MAEERKKYERVAQNQNDDNVLVLWTRTSYLRRRTHNDRMCNWRTLWNDTNDSVECWQSLNTRKNWFHYMHNEHCTPNNDDNWTSVSLYLAHMKFRNISFHYILAIRRLNHRPFDLSFISYF